MSCFILHKWQYFDTSKKSVGNGWDSYTGKGRICKDCGKKQEHVSCASYDESWFEWHDVKQLNIPHEEPISAGEVYEHYKGSLYKILHLGVDAELDVPNVIYIKVEPIGPESSIYRQQFVDTGKVFSRTQPNWKQKVFHNGKLVPRFKRINI